MDITPDNIINLAYLSDKYLVHSLKYQCIKHFCEHILRRDNAIRRAGLYNADMCVIPEIRNATMAYIQTFASKIFEQDIEYDELTRDMLEQILEKDFLNCNEYVLYLVCYEWAQHQCKRRGQPVQPKDIAEELGDLLQLIRFPTMSWIEFADLSKHGVLNSEDGKKMLEYIQQKDFAAMSWIDFDHMSKHGVATSEDEKKLVEYIQQKDYSEQGKNDSQKPLENETNMLAGVPFNCVRRSHYGKFENDKHAGDDYWISYSVDVREGSESSICNIFAVKSHKECKKGCLVLSVEVPVYLLAFRLQLDELVCHRYSEEGVSVRVIITQKSSVYGKVKSQYIETLDVCPTDSPVNQFHYHEAGFQKPVTLDLHCIYEVVLECENLLYYYEVPHDHNDYRTPPANLAKPFRIRWDLTKMACEKNGCVSNLIHGVNYKVQDNFWTGEYSSRPRIVYYVRDEYDW